MINRVQKLQFELMKEASFNDFDGEQVVRDLEAHEDLWEGAVMDRAYGNFSTKANQYIGGVDLIKLRDINAGYWSVDTLFIEPRAGKEDELMALSRDWQADEASWIDGEEACKLLGSYSKQAAEKTKVILRLWWD